MCEAEMVTLWVSNAVEEKIALVLKNQHCSFKEKGDLVWESKQES